MNNLSSLKELVNRFKLDEQNYVHSSSTYQETEVRVEFIDPLFEILGWKMNNSDGVSTSLRDVLREESLLSERTTKKPDYTFRIAGIKKFFLEAKRPSVDIRNSKESAIQVRSYGYTAGLPISILTNFRTLSIYDTRLEPKPGDGVDVGLIKTIEFEEFPQEIEWLEERVGREAVARGGIDKYFEVSSTGIIPANESFLNRINGWRVRLGEDLHSKYPSLTIDEITDFTQKIINRIIFIRMCEDRGIEGEGLLRKAANKKSVLELRALFKQMDNRYNTGLFDVTKDRLNDTYEISTELFLDIVNEVYAPNSPYSFSVLDADFLGQVYELFLVQKLSTENNAIVLVNKPSYLHREIVTTPQVLVSELVRRTFQAKFEALKATDSFNIENILSLRVLDIAVGSGRFLLQAFDFFVDSAIEALKESKNKKFLYEVSDSVYRLDFNIKKEILTNCLYGIDIDYNAVEIARFSLMVRLLEEEVKGTLPDGQKILPDLDINIIHGNSIVSSNFIPTNDSELTKTVPLDWDAARLPEGFDLVIGNPPYLKTEEMKDENIGEFNYLKANFDTPYKQFDKYFLFIEVGLRKTKADGFIGLVVPNKWINNESGTKLRGILGKNRYLSQIVNFGSEKLFDGKSAYVCLLVLTKTGSDSFEYRFVNSTEDFLLRPDFLGLKLKEEFVRKAGSNPWVLPSSDAEMDVLTKLNIKATPLSDIAVIQNGIQTSANPVFLIENYDDLGTHISFEKNGKVWVIEKLITRPHVNDSSSLISYKTIVADALVIFPYTVVNSFPRIIPLETLIKSFPLAYEYLLAHKKRLLARDVSPPQTDGVFYAYGRHQSLDAVFSHPKIVYSVNQKGDKYALDKEGVSYSSGGTAGEVAIFNPKLGYSLEFILGLLNQKAIEFFARKRGSAFGGGFYSRGSSVVSDIPVPILDIENSVEDKKTHEAIVENVRSLIAVIDLLSTASGRDIQNLINKKNALNNKIEKQFDELFGFSEEIKSLILPGDI